MTMFCFDVLFVFFLMLQLQTWPLLDVLVLVTIKVNDVYNHSISLSSSKHVPNFTHGIDQIKQNIIESLLLELVRQLCSKSEAFL